MHVLGSFIFGLPTDTPETFAATADLAQRAGVSFAQFVMLQPLPGTIDFARWEREAKDVPIVDGVPLTRYWLIPPERRPRVYSPHPIMTADELRSRTQDVWDRLLRIESRLAALEFLEESSARGWRSCSSPSCIARCTPIPALPPTAPASSARRCRARWLARFARRLFASDPMPALREPTRVP